MILSPLPIQKFFDNNGRPLDGGLLFTYVAGTSTPIATYTDSTGITQNTNPIALDFRGECRVWLDESVTYKFILSPPGDTNPPTKSIWTVDGISVPLSPSDITQQFLGQIIYPRTSAEIAAGVIPVYYIYPPGDIRRYGALGDGITDNSIAITNAVASNVVITVPFATGNYNVAITVHILAGITIKFDGGIINQTAGTFALDNKSHLAASETQQCFTNSSVVTIGDDVVANVYVAWWGFGFTFTGTQNKAALMSAMNALLFGGTIVLPRSGCFLDGDIVPPFAGLRLLGQGWASGYNNTTQFGTTLLASSGTNLFDLSAYFGGPNPNEYFKLEGIKCDGNNAIPNGIKIMGTKTVSGCTFTGFTGIGIWFADFINGSLVENSTCVANAGVGMLVDGTSTTKFSVKNSNFRINLRGMEIRSGANFTLQDCVFESNTLQGLFESNSDGRNLAFGLHINLWFENNNSVSGTRNQFTLGTTATSSAWYPLGNRWINGVINGSSVIGQRAMDINLNCLRTVFQGTRFGGQVGDTGAIFVAAGTGTIFDDCDAVDTFGSASAANYRQRFISQATVLQIVTTPYSASITIDAYTGSEFIITATNNTAFTINAPLHPNIGQSIEIMIRNTSGGALGAVTWDPIFKMSAWAQPANANSRTIAFWYNGANWVQRFQATVDVPN